MKVLVNPQVTLINAGVIEFSHAKDVLVSNLSTQVPINRGKWQSETTSVAAYELSNVMFSYEMPKTLTNLRENVPADIEWADEHFRERVGGEPLNPAPSYVRWPYHSSKEAERHVANGVFAHTYPERMWPKRAGQEQYKNNMDSDQWQGGTSGFFSDQGSMIPAYGIRYNYGDLQDVVNQLVKDPFTRQAYLPIWFPEDTGATEGQRVPCTLGYHFIRNGPKLDCNYFIRSCDIYRHFTNDVYLAIRLTHWIYDQVVLQQKNSQFPVWPGHLNMFISNLHMFTADEWRFTT